MLPPFLLLQVRSFSLCAHSVWLAPFIPSLYITSIMQTSGRCSHNTALCKLASVGRGAAPFRCSDAPRPVALHFHFTSPWRSFRRFTCGSVMRPAFPRRCLPTIG